VSKPKVFEKPSGMKDYLPGAVSRLRSIESRVLACMEKWGYRQIMTPTLEYYDTVGVTSATSDKKLFKLLDNRGTTLVMRSDMTAPIARVIASLLKDEPLPIRLAYHASVFRAIEEEAGRDAEFFQTGVELVGDPSPDADAEVIALAVASLQAAGITHFKLAMGHQGLLNGLLQELLQDRPADQEQLKERLLARDYVGYRRLIRSMDVPADIQAKLEGILELRGGKEVCSKMSEYTADEHTRASIHELCEIWEALSAYGVQEHAMIDLTMIGNFSYYTGMIFEAYSAELGFPVASGGRYDNLLQQFGRPAPATGFALKTTRILDILGTGETAETKRVLVAYVPEQRREAYQLAAGLRGRDGYAVETRCVSSIEAGQDPEQTAEGKLAYMGKIYDEIILLAGESDGGVRDE